MVLDPLSALALAGNIIQFVDFGSTFVQRVVKLYRSASGLTEEHEEIVFLANRLKADADEICRNVIEEDPGKPGLAILAKLCQNIADETLGMVEDLRVQPEGSKMASLRQSFRTLSKKDKVHGLVGRVGQLRDALNTQLLNMLK
jgi:hypothetical protein